MIRTNLPLQRFRLWYFPFHIIVEICMLVLFLALPIYSESVPLNFGVFTFWGWLLASSSFIIIIFLVVIFLSNFTFTKQSLVFFQKEKLIQNLAYFLAYFCLLRIGLIAVSLIFITPFNPDRGIIYLVIFGLSLFPPLLLYFVANCRSLPEKIFAFSQDAPLSIKLTAFWILFLTGAMQILSDEYTILIISLILLFVSYFFFNLYTLAVIITPLLLLIHACYSIFLSVVVLIQIDNPEILANIYTKTELIFVIILFFLLPSIISLILTGTFFNKKIHQWIRNLSPSSEMELELPYSYDGDDVDNEGSYENEEE